MNTNAKTARIAGILYVLVIIGGVFAEFVVRSNLIVAGATSATIDNLRSNEALFRIGFISDLVAHTCYFLLAFVLYTLLKPVQHDIALLFLLIVVIAAPLLCLNMLNQFMALLILTEANYLSAFTAAQVDALVMLFLDLHKYGYLIGQIFYGGWLFPLGYVVYKSGYFPKLLGRLLMVASVGYVLDFFRAFLLPDADAALSGILLAPSVIAEFSFCLWLLVKGANPAKVNAGFVPETASAIPVG